MKYIKLFESIKHYEQISKMQYIVVTSKYIDEIDDKEYGKIVSKLKFKNNFRLYTSSISYKKIYIKLTNDKKEFFIHINKIDDDYYYVSLDLDSNHGVYYYKCDQINSILQLIIDLTSDYKMVKREYIDMIFSDFTKIWDDTDYEEGEMNRYINLNRLSPSLRQDCKNMFLSFVDIPENRLGSCFTNTWINDCLYYISDNTDKIKSFKEYYNNTDRFFSWLIRL